MKLYYGYYVDQRTERLLCISPKKKLVEFYLTAHRHLDQDQYEIYRKITNNPYTDPSEEEYLISEWNGYYIPYIDQLTSEIFHRDTKENVYDLLVRMKDFILSLDGYKKISKKEKRILLDSFEIIAKYKNDPEIINGIEKNAISSEPILYCNIDDYFQYIKRAKEFMEMENRFKDVMAE